MATAAEERKRWGNVLPGWADSFAEFAREYDPVIICSDVRMGDAATCLTPGAVKGMVRNVPPWIVSYLCVVLPASLVANHVVPIPYNLLVTLLLAVATGVTTGVWQGKRDRRRAAANRWKPGQIPAKVQSDERYYLVCATSGVALWHLNGADWNDPPPPPRWHRHWAQTVGVTSSGELWKCACGAVRLGPKDSWRHQTVRQANTRWIQELAARLSCHSDSLAVIRAPRRKAKRRTNRRERQQAKAALREVDHG